MAARTLAGVAIAALAGTAQAGTNGLGATPAMGLNLWNSLACNYNVTDLLEIADLVVSEGYLAAGYTYFNLDDCWQSGRQPNGTIIPDPAKFPAGIQPYFDALRAKGLQPGVYTDAGLETCAGRPGSYGYEAIDAATYASWGVRFVKADNCNVPINATTGLPVDPVVRYSRLGAALNATGTPIWFSACIWGVSQPWLWMQPYANSWRMDDDIANDYDSFSRVLGNAHGLSQFAAPYAGFNDLDMLEVGNFNDAHADALGAAHFALWSLFKSQLLIGTDLRRASAATKATLQATEVIAVNQDPLGVAGDLVWGQGPARVYAGPLADGSRAVVLTNFHHYGSQFPTVNVTVSFIDIGYGSLTTGVVRDLYARADLGTFTGSFTGAVPLHGCLALRITPVAAEERDVAWRPWHAKRAAVVAAPGASATA